MRVSRRLGRQFAADGRVGAGRLRGARRAEVCLVVAGAPWSQAGVAGSAARRSNAAVSSFAQGQLSWRRSVAVRAWKARRPAMCRSR